MARKPILWHSNAPKPLSFTGYGDQTGEVVPRVAKAGYDVAVSCMTAVGDHIGELDGITMLPGGMTPYSSDILPAHAEYWFGNDPGLIITLYDAWAIGPEAVVGRACAAWTPVHSRPMSVGDQRFFALSGAQPLAMSRFGEAQMRARNMEPVYIPHGVDTAKFRPLTGEERATVRRRIKVPTDAFLVVMVGANKGKAPARKSWGEALAAFAAFHQRHTEAVLFIHSFASSAFGLDMRPLIADLGIGDCVIFSSDYRQWVGLYPDEYIAAIEGTADVLLQPSMGEGFGLSALQAQACGTPVIVGDNSAQPEVCGSGWLAECQDWWYEDDQAWWATVFTRSIVAALEKAWTAGQSENLTAKYRDAARQFALGYDMDRVFAEYWLPALDMLEQYAGLAKVRPPGRKLEVNAAGLPTGNLTADLDAIPLPTIEAGGMRWLARGSHTDDWIAVEHEATLEPVLDDLMPEGGVLLDVGAHIGRWALRLAGKASQVVAVEPNPATAAVLRYHIALNEVPNVTVIEAAAWDEMTRLTLEDPNERVTGGSTRTLEPGGLEDPERDSGLVQAAPLDLLLGLHDDEGPSIPQLDLVKLDVEGSDLRALAGMAGLLKRFQPVLFIEDHSIYGYYEHETLISLLVSLGYEPKPFMARLPADRSAPYVIATPAQGDTR